LYGKIVDRNYTQLWHSNDALDLKIVSLLDKVQKEEVISKEDFNELKKSGLVEGRYPNIFVSYKVANIA
jgi:ATP-dependent DNA helicase RecG